MTEKNDPAIEQQARKLTRGRKFNADELQLKILWFLREAPAHGYELSQRFGELSGDYYRPSSGVLYPALAQLETLGYARVEQSGKRKVYHLESAGQAFLDEHNQTAELLIATLRHSAKKMLWMSQLSSGEAAAADATGWLPEFIHARKALHAALLSCTDADHAQQRRIIDILLQAAQDISAVSGQ